MHPVTTACACAAIATVAGIGVAQLSTDTRAALAGQAVALLRLTPLYVPSAMPPSRTLAAPSDAVMPGGKSLALAPDRYGQYHVEMEVEGRRVPVLVDTGASWVSLSDTAAAELGFFPAPSDFTIAMATANGIAHAAPIEIAELRVGPIVGRRVKAMVMPRGALTTPALLGMSFLRGLSGFSVRDGRLVLEQ
jgi:aspartyl protease family protein